MLEIMPKKGPDTLIPENVFGPINFVGGKFIFLLFPISPIVPVTLKLRSVAIR